MRFVLGPKNMQNLRVAVSAFHSNYMVSRQLLHPCHHMQIIGAFATLVILVFPSAVGGARFASDPGIVETATNRCDVVVIVCRKAMDLFWYGVTWQATARG